MKTIYLATEHIDYEGASIIKAFESEADANIFINRCNEYMKKKPSCCHISDLDADAWDEFFKEDTFFRENHPAGKSFACGDSYIVMPIEYKENSDAK